VNANTDQRHRLERAAAHFAAQPNGHSGLVGSDDDAPQEAQDRGGRVALVATGPDRLRWHHVSLKAGAPPTAAEDLLVAGLLLAVSGLGVIALNLDATVTLTGLAIVLRAGALPAPVQVLEERTVGPSLGADSIRQGIIAILASTALVFLFMLVYYRLSGFIADVALGLNLLLLLATMAGFHATLTLPGIAGIALTIGMAVDTNILIFERIREELRGGKTVRGAIDAGFSRAFKTVIDTHVTVLVSGLILFQFGTGPVKGFAVTLMIGIAASLFTAVFFTRLLFDLIYMGRHKRESLSI